MNVNHICPCGDEEDYHDMAGDRSCVLCECKIFRGRPLKIASMVQVSKEMKIDLGDKGWEAYKPRLTSQLLEGLYREAAEKELTIDMTTVKISETFDLPRLVHCYLAEAMSE